MSGEIDVTQQATVIEYNKRQAKFLRPLIDKHLYKYMAGIILEYLEYDLELYVGLIEELILHNLSNIRSFAYYRPGMEHPRIVERIKFSLAGILGRDLSAPPKNYDYKDGITVTFNKRFRKNYYLDTHVIITQPWLVKEVVVFKNPPRPVTPPLPTNYRRPVSPAYRRRPASPPASSYPRGFFIPGMRTSNLRRFDHD